MARIDQLLESYKRHVALPLRPGLPLSQRVWFLVYSPEDERRMAVRISEFGLATQEAGLDWHLVGFTGAFADWLDTLDEEERAICLRDPEVVENYAERGLRDFLCQRLRDAVDSVPPERAEHTVFVVTGLMELYDFVHVSAVLDELDPHFPGVLLVCFPGEREGNTYRFLGARTGWDYLAIPILADNRP